jgi:hypothetical protein
MIGQILVQTNSLRSLLALGRDLDRLLSSRVHLECAFITLNLIIHFSVTAI